jgi:hypothetical protein
MPRTYPKTADNLRPGKLDDATFHSIGRLIRATAEIEDIVDCFIANLAGLSESRVQIFLGRTAITRRLEMAETLAKIRTDGALAAYKEAFPAEFNDVLECRNTVAHGILLGSTDLGEFAFLTTPTGSVEGESTMRIVAAYHPLTILNFAQKAEAMVPWLEERLKVQEMRAERLQRPLMPHPKAQDRGRATQKRPPQSSPA